MQQNRADPRARDSEELTHRIDLLPPGRAKLVLLWLDDIIARVACVFAQLLAHAGGPGDFDAVDVFRVAEAEVGRARRLRQIPARRLHLARQDVFAAIDADHGADGVPVAPRAL